MLNARREREEALIAHILATHTCSECALEIVSTLQAAHRREDAIRKRCDRAKNAFAVVDLHVDIFAILDGDEVPK